MPSSLLRFVSVGVVATAAFAWSAAARADIPPPDQCASGDVGKACNNAGAKGDAPGFCAESMCPHYSPSGGGATQNPCTICQPSAPAPSGDGDASMVGCSTSPLVRDGAVGFAMFGLGLAALMWSRRRT